MTDPLQSTTDALDAFAQGPAQRSARALEDAFARASNSIAANLSRAAAQGEVSFQRLAASALSSLANIAIDRIVQPALSSPSGAKSVTVNMQVNGAQPDTFSRSKGQVAQGLAQAVSEGMRRL